MDTLLSPRRRTLLQALGAAALVAACGDRRSVAVAPVRRVRRPDDRAPGSPRRSRVRAWPKARSASRATRLPAPSRPSLRGCRRTSPIPSCRSSTVTPPQRPLRCPPTRSRSSRSRNRWTPHPAAPSTSRSLRWSMPGASAPARPAASSPRIRPRGSPHTSIGSGSRSTSRQERPRRLDAELRADLSGVAKGYAVDQAAHALERLGIADYLIEAGGEVRTRGVNGEGRPWRIAIERPDADAATPALHRAALRIRDRDVRRLSDLSRKAAAATRTDRSGDAQRSGMDWLP